MLRPCCPESLSFSNSIAGESLPEHDCRDPNSKSAISPFEFNYSELKDAQWKMVEMFSAGDLQLLIIKKCTQTHDVLLKCAQTTDFFKFL